MREHLGQYPLEDASGTVHESRWLREKLQASIRHLRDIEDYYRTKGGLPGGFNQVRADRARECYEHISTDFVNGKTTAPTLFEAAKALYEQVETDEAAGICLSDRVAALNLGARLQGSP